MRDLEKEPLTKREKEICAGFMTCPHPTMVKDFDIFSHRTPLPPGVDGVLVKPQCDHCNEAAELSLSINHYEGAMFLCRKCTERLHDLATRALSAMAMVCESCVPLYISPNQVAAYLAGHCRNCGRKLPDGWKTNGARS